MHRSKMDNTAILKNISFYFLAEKDVQYHFLKSSTYLDQQYFIILNLST